MLQKMPTFRNVVIVAALTAAAWAQNPVPGATTPLLGEDTVKVSDHVWAIMGFPNIAIVVGTRATLVVDTGLGPRNGATVARVAAKLSAPNAKLYLTTTHFHPEHAAGDAGFPAGTILVRNAEQQREMDVHGKEVVERFSSSNPQRKELLADTNLRTPDVIYNDDARIDLGGASARLLWFGRAHTNGDELILVEPEQTLISGDVVQNKTVPNISGDGGTPASWIEVLDKIAALNVLHVLPDHSAPGDGSLVTQERAFIADVETRALALKRQGVSVEDAGKQLSAEFKTKYADWPYMNLAAFVKSVYAE
jgi:glyoxylase-like metal-dependent hydrolase (beta-lactamase superfamily II)